MRPVLEIVEGFTPDEPLVEKEPDEDWMAEQSKLCMATTQTNLGFYSDDLNICVSIMYCIVLKIVWTA